MSSPTVASLGLRWKKWDIKEYLFHFLIKHLIWFQNTSLRFTGTEKNVIKNGKKVKPKKDILIHKRLYLLSLQQKTKQNKKKLACKAEKAFIYQPWSETISWTLSVKVNAMYHKNIQYYYTLWWKMFFMWYNLTICCFIVSSFIFWLLKNTGFYLFVCFPLKVFISLWLLAL